jgi:hypothetical protein
MTADERAVACASVRECRLSRRLELVRVVAGTGVDGGPKLLHQPEVVTVVPDLRDLAVADKKAFATLIRAAVSLNESSSR